MESKMVGNGIEYVRVGDYYIPNLKLPHEERPIGRYGRMHRDYLREHNPVMFDDLVVTGRLWTYLADLNEQAENRLQLMIQQMQEAEAVTEALKASDQLAWVQAMNSIRSRAEEILREELIFA